jgi:hypothetical protein
VYRLGDGDTLFLNASFVFTVNASTLDHDFGIYVWLSRAAGAGRLGLRTGLKATSEGLHTNGCTMVARLVSTGETLLMHIPGWAMGITEGSP